MKLLIAVILLFSSLKNFASTPNSSSQKYVELLPYVQLAPDQGQSGTCLFMATTGAIELIANKKHNIRFPHPSGPFDLSELYTIHAKEKNTPGKSFFELPLYKYFRGIGVHHDAWPFNKNMDPWKKKNSARMLKVEVPIVTSLKLFDFNDRHATYVLNQKHVQKIKQALLKYHSPHTCNKIKN